MAGVKTALLHKTLRTYLFFSLLVLVVTAPLFYFTIEKLYIDDADEALMLRKNEFQNHYVSHFKIADIENWNFYNRDKKIIPADKRIVGDSFFLENYIDTLDDYENEPYRVLYSPVSIEGKPYVFAARINLVETEDLIKSIVVVYLVMLTLLFLILIFITDKLTIYIWQPFFDTLAKIETFEIDKMKSVSLEETDIAEFHRLNQSIEKLVVRNQEIYRSQKEFVENAAHELQTPLAVFRSKLETLIQQPELTQQQSEIIFQLNEAASRLNNLNKNLLLLSRIDNNQFHGTETLNWDDIIIKHFDFFKEQADAKGIKIFYENNSDVRISCNPVLAEIFVNNLFLNAIRHNRQNGVIKIQQEGHSLMFSNTGDGTPLNNEKLFTRFSKNNPSEQGSGLGLAIIKRIADLYNWEVSYSFTIDGNMHVFSIRS